MRLFIWRTNRDTIPIPNPYLHSRQASAELGPQVPDPTDFGLGALLPNQALTRAANICPIVGNPSPKLVPIRLSSTHSQNA
jgi:hypothetical protein